MEEKPAPRSTQPDRPDLNRNLARRNGAIRAQEPIWRARSFGPVTERIRTPQGPNGMQ